MSNRGCHVPRPDLKVECGWENNPRLLVVGTLTYSIRPDGLVECERTDHTCRVVEPPEALKSHVRRVTGKSYEDFVTGVVEEYRSRDGDGVGNRQ